MALPVDARAVSGWHKYGPCHFEVMVGYNSFKTMHEGQRVHRYSWPRKSQNVCTLYMYIALLTWFGTLRTRSSTTCLYEPLLLGDFATATRRAFANGDAALEVDEFGLAHLALDGGGVGAAEALVKNGPLTWILKLIALHIQLLGYSVFSYIHIYFYIICNVFLLLHVVMMRWN